MAEDTRPEPVLIADLDQEDARLQALVPVMWRFFDKCMESGFTDQEALTLLRDWWEFRLVEDE